MRRPNILVMLSDDHGAWAMPGPDGAVQAPNLAWLAATGTRMARACTPSPVCSPARASFWSGLLPSAHGIHDFLQEPGPGAEHPGLCDRNLGERLQGAGYQTLFSGKWHCGGAGSPQSGFDRWASMISGTNARFGPQPFDVDGVAVERYGHQAPMIADDAIRFLRERPVDRPFFAFVGLTDTHTPLDQAQPRLRHVYRDLAITPPHDEPFASCHGMARFPVPKDRAVQRSELIDYLAAVTSIDEQLGRLLDEVRNQGVLEDTVIVYTTDHGHLNGHYGLMTKGNATVPQNLLDGSLLVPCIWRGPGIAAGAVRHEPVDHCDLHVSLAELGGCAAWELDTPSPGSSYLPLLRGETRAWRDWQVAEYGNARMWRDADWKVIQRFPGPNGHFPDELYDLRADPRETRDVRSEHPEIVADRARRLDAHFAHYERPAQSGRCIAECAQSAAVSPWLLDPRTLQPLAAG